MAVTNSFLQSKILCPMYIGDDGKRCIKCEGVIDRSYITMHFRRKEDFRKQMWLFCCRKYQYCEVYRMIMEKYEES